MPKAVISKEFLQKEYVQNNKSILDISNAVGVHYSTIYRKLQDFGLTKVQCRHDINKKILNKLYLKEGLSIAKIAKMLNCDRSTIHRRLLKFNIPTKKYADYSFEKNISKKQLNDLYNVKNFSTYAISKYLGCSRTTVRKLLRIHNLKIKTANKNNLKINIAGRIFGELTAVKAFKKDEYGRIYWECLCSCGNISYPAISSLLRKNRPVKSCGCNIKTRQDENNIIPAYIYNRIIKSAKSRKIKIDISKKYIDNLFIHQNGKCALSGQKLVFHRYPTTSNTTASLDRIDSSIGYIKDNVQWIHKDINKMKGIMSNNDLIKICKLISDHNLQSE